MPCPPDAGLGEELGTEGARTEVLERWNQVIIGDL